MRGPGCASQRTAQEQQAARLEAEAAQAKATAQALDEITEESA